MLQTKVSQRQRKSPKIWSTTATMHFLHCAADTYEAVGNNKKGVHKKIAAALNSVLKECPGEPEVTVDHVRHKYEALRKQWLVWQSLCNKTGSGWDPVKGTVCGTEEWWDDRVKEFGTNILKYQRGSIENMDLLQIIFQGTHATGAAPFTPATAHEDESPNIPRSPPRSQTFQTSFDRTWEFDEMCRNIEDVQVQPTQFFPSMRQPFMTPPSMTPPLLNPTSTFDHGSASGFTGHGGVSRKCREEENLLKQKVSTLIDPIYERQIKKSRSDTGSPNTNSSPNSVDSTSSSFSYTALANRVKMIGQLDVGEALTILMDKDKREMFNALDDDTARSWLTVEIAQMKHKIQYEQYLINKSDHNP